MATCSSAFNLILKCYLQVQVLRGEGGGGLKCGLKCNGSLGCEQVYTDVIVFVGNNRALKDLHFV